MRADEAVTPGRPARPVVPPFTRVVATLRSRLVVLPALVVAAAVGLGVFLLAPATYRDTSDILLVGPQQKAGNPLLTMGPALVSTADAIRVNVMGARAGDDLVKAGATASYLVTVDRKSAAPVLRVTVSDEDPRTTRATTIAVVKQIQTALGDVQERTGAASSTWVRATVLSSLPAPLAQRSVPVWKAAAAAVLAFLLGLAGFTAGRLMLRPAEPGRWPTAAVFPEFPEPVGPPPATMVEVIPLESAEPVEALEPLPAIEGAVELIDTKPVAARPVSARPVKSRERFMTPIVPVRHGRAASTPAKPKDGRGPSTWPF